VSSYNILYVLFFSERTGEIWYTSPLARTQHYSITGIWEAQSCHTIELVPAISLLRLESTLKHSRLTSRLAPLVFDE
jgi:hypothetical protein